MSKVAKIGTKSLIFPTVVLGIVLSCLLISLVLERQLGLKMSRQLPPLIDASMEIKANSALFHLWFEEYIQGDPYISEDQFWFYLNESQWYANAMLKGDSNHEGTFIPLDDPEVTEKIKTTLSGIALLREAANQRLQMLEYAGIASEFDQAFDERFEFLIKEADELETVLQNSIARIISHFELITVTLILFSFFSGLTVIAGFVYYELRRQRDMELQLILVEQAGQAKKLEAIGMIAGGIAHEFNNILASVIANIDLATEKTSNRLELDEELTSIETLSFRAASLTSQLLAYAGKDMMGIELMPFADNLREMLPVLASTLPEKITLEHEIAGQPLFIKGGPSHLQRLMIELLRNAADAVDSVSSPMIRIGLNSFEPDKMFLTKYADAKAGSYAHLSVSDNGCGIAEQDQEKLFDPFFTTKHTKFFTTKHTKKGHGLGLSMVFGVIEMHKGLIHVESSPGNGTEFHIYLPLAEAPFVHEVDNHLTHGSG